MKYRRLGRSGLKVSQVCLGTMTFGREADEAASFQILDRYADLGGTFIDTADVYSAGVSEEIVGRWLKQRGSRDSIVLASKVSGTMGPGPNEGGLSRLHIQQAVEASLRRLKTDVIDLYQIHQWDAETPPEETLQALDDLVRQGKVRYLGSSNLYAYQLATLLALSRANGWSTIISHQPLYNALNRAIELEILPLCAAEGLGVLCYNPLAGGMLTGKYQRGQAMPQGRRLEAFGSYYERYYGDRAFDVIEALVSAATQRHQTPAQLALAWACGDPRITCPILGARSIEQFNDTIQGLDINLTPQDRAGLPAIPSGQWVGRDPVYGPGLR